MLLDIFTSNAEIQVQHSYQNVKIVLVYGRKRLMLGILAQILCLDNSGALDCTIVKQGSISIVASFFPLHLGQYLLLSKSKH